MEVRFSPEQEARLSKIATKEGVDPEKLVKDAALRLLEDDAASALASEKGSNRLTRASSSKKKKWTPASNACFVLEASKKDIQAMTTFRRNPGEFMNVSRKRRGR